MAEWVFKRELWPLRRPSLVAELAAHRQQGANLILCSAMYEPLMETFAERLRAATGSGRIAVATATPFPTSRCSTLRTAPVAVHPDAGLRKIAVSRGWRIVGVTD